MKILFATDGSEGALDAARFLAALEHRDDTYVHIFTIPASSLDEDREKAEENLAHARETLGAFPACMSTEIGPSADTNSEIAESIINRAGTLRADLVVVGTHGRSAFVRWFVGSVALNVARHSLCPVLLARAPHGAIDRILAGVDGSSCARNAVRWTLEHLPLPPSGAVRLLGIAALPALVWSEPMLAAPLAEETARLLEEEEARLKEALSHLANEVQASSLTVTTETRLGTVAGGLIETAKEWEADLVAVGSHGYSSIDRWLLGSVSEGVLQRSPCSVLVVR